ncbi:MAG: type II toxin-antitoxin system VapC family toxin [Candidatus Limnocylindrales bacterium]
MGLTVLDAGVLIALLDANDGHHAASIGALQRCRERADDFVLPMSAYAEILVAPSRGGLKAVAIVDGFVDALPAVVEPITRPIAARAAALRAQSPTLRLPDALVLATALVLRADRLLTTDRRWPDVGAGVEVV